MSFLAVALQIIGALGVFLYGLKVMSEGLQKASGSRLRSMLHRATDNRISGTFSGFLVTCLVQSSSATTVMIGPSDNESSFANLVAVFRHVRSRISRVDH